MLKNNQERVTCTKLDQNQPKIQILLGMTKFKRIRIKLTEICQKQRDYRVRSKPEEEPKVIKFDQV